MDLATQPTEFLARMVFTGTKQLDELPTGRRHAVARCVEQLKAEAEEAVKQKAKKKKGKRKNAGKKRSPK